MRRTLHASENRSEWQLDGRDARQKDVVERVASLNIQLDNLCQVWVGWVCVRGGGEGGGALPNTQLDNPCQVCPRPPSPSATPP